MDNMAAFYNTTNGTSGVYSSDVVTGEFSQTIGPLNGITLDYFNSTSGNTTDPHGPDSAGAYQRNEDLAKLEIAVQGIIFCLAVFGNGMVLVVLLALRRKKLTRMNMMIVHLSCADLFVAFFNVLPQLVWDITHRFKGEYFLCKFVKYFQVVAMYASAYVLVSTAIDRYLAICHPLTIHSWTMRKMHLLVAVAWMLSLVFSIPQLTIFSYKEIESGTGVYDCWGEFRPEWTLQLYVTWFTIAIYIIPFFLLSIAYGRICYVVWRSMKSKEPIKDHKKMTTNGNGRSTNSRACADRFENGSLLSPEERNTGSRNNTPKRHMITKPRAHMRGMSKAKVKTVKLTLTVIVCYLLCWGPFFVSQMWAAWDPNAPFEDSAFVIIMLLASLNSCTNPWVYLAFSDTFHRRLWLCWRRPQPRHIDRSSTFDSDTRMRTSLSSTYPTDVSRLDHNNSFILLVRNHKKLTDNE